MHVWMVLNFAVAHHLLTLTHRRAVMPSNTKCVRRGHRRRPSLSRISLTLPTPGEHVKDLSSSDTVLPNVQLPRMSHTGGALQHKQLFLPNREVLQD
jgi:hypothetical protein